MTPRRLPWHSADKGVHVAPILPERGGEVKSAITLKSFTTSSLTFVDQATAGTGAEHVMVISPQGTINPGETKTLNLTLRDPVWVDTRMIEVNRPRIEVAGQLIFRDASGTEGQTTVASSVNPKLI